MKTENGKAAQTPEDILNELRNLVIEAERLLGQAPHGATHNYETLLNELRERFEATQEKFSGFSSDAKRKVVDGAKRTDEAIHDHPYQSIAIALGVGLLAGLLLSRRSNPSAS